MPKLENIEVDSFWFQQNEKINLLQETFGECIISRLGPLAWPSRSSDITPLDYCLWGYVKSVVYAEKPETVYAFATALWLPEMVVNGPPAGIIIKTL